MSEKLMVGGQAVIEGVMMRGPKKVATAVRGPSGVITVDVKPINSLAEKYPIFKKPFFRGILSLGESLVMGLKSLTYSAQMAGITTEGIEHEKSNRLCKHKRSWNTERTGY